MKKSTKLLTIPIILGAIFLGLPAPAVNADISPNIPITEFYSLMECARVSFAREYPNEVINDSLTDEQLAKIEEISSDSCRSYNYPLIINMDGLEKLTSLEALYIDIGNISSVDFSHNPNLKNLELRGKDCEYNGNRAESILSSINLSNNPKLETLGLTNNPIESLDLSNNSKLETLWLMDSPIEFLDLSNNSELKDLYVTVNPLVETGITPEKDGDKLVYNLSSLKFLTPSDDGAVYFPICDNIDCDNEHITYDEENMILYVDNLEAIGGEVQAFHCVLEVCSEYPFRLKLNEPKEEPEEDTLLSPDTGVLSRNPDAAGAIFPVFGISLGALIALLSHIYHKRDNLKLE